MGHPGKEVRNVMNLVKTYAKCAGARMQMWRVAAHLETSVPRITVTRLQPEGRSIG